jgi:thiol:disulfide interchange protein/DsbC/DsbD-like thiol-disulfide interchange protein
MLRPRNWALNVERWTLSVCSFLATASLLSAQTYEGRQLVKAELLADTNAIVPGKPFTAGLLLRMAPHWHTYWKFSGDAGIPTEIKWQLPEGWKVGEIQWPIPLKLKDPGDIETYGYSDEVLLAQEITPPSKIDNSEVKLTAHADWLVCEKICIPGSANLELTLPRSTSSIPANAELFAKYRMPPFSGALEMSLKQMAYGANEISFTLKGPGFKEYSFADFFPLPDEKTVVGHPIAQIHGDELVVRIPIEGKLPNDPPTIESPRDVGIPGLIVLSHGAADENRTGFYIGKFTSAKPSGAPAAAPAAATRGFWTFLLFGFIGGFILNLMPCVLPVISLKIFGFIKHAGKDRQAILRNGLAFVAGIFAWFIGLALLLIALKAAGHEITWAAQFTNPYFVLGLSVIVLVFALDLFGVFEITLPQVLMHRVLHSATREGEAGSFFQGVFATILATPCTAPFLGTAIGFAFTQSPAVIVVMFASVAAGMSAPYFLLSVQPAWLRFLPTPGPWMERVKQFMGFLLLATLVFLLYVLGAQRGYEALIWACSFLLVISVACWIKGAFVTPVASFATRSVALVLMLALVAGSGIYFIGDKFRSAKIDISEEESSDGWQRFTPERLQSELDQNHSVFVDFTAAWCITCKFNEKSVLESTQVRDAFQRYNIVKIKADWTNGDPAITKLLQRFGRPGVPLYVLFRGKTGEPFVFPELLTKNIILEKLETVTVASQ